MKYTIALGAALAATASAAPLVDLGSSPKIELEKSPIDKQMIGGLSTPSVFSSTLNTKTAPINYGNLNQGTGMMPSQVVHYGVENQPDHGYVSPVLVSSTGKELVYQTSKAEKAKDLRNVDADVGTLNLKGSTRYVDMDVDMDAEEHEKWGMFPPWRRPFWYRPWWYRPWY
ncbi:hypothetical protein BC939DRAFT_472350 [Gamsiella multidivaricata]|uniref:uncharacterized protein n=1 Tax=Gamsiella multidivaricata TaxID=101098 RepID=UPI002221077E|nr:uncharacterized protein BC939DRAFT_472350 [Gamsiella multidivaricata]KAG0366293.1 hypothetical protein BGZ54_005552 [Gamsiella multidivaricata]KAI7832769.1 hypothetical protein BC939DRAFT_472350 [Gamsiella multidivaricata]